MTSANDQLIGRRFYDYLIERKLAEGGMGAVYLLRNVRVPDIVKVLKVLLPEYAAIPDLRQRFEREAAAVAKLRHRNILGIDSVGTLDDGQPCMLMPFLEGQPLDAYLHAHGGRLPPHRVFHFAAQIANALHCAHGLGIVHRDLKPGNVFVVPDDQDPMAIKVLDFGIAKQMTPEANALPSSLLGPIGTPCYMAPEQYEHAADATPLADVYALAVMMWEMVTGRLPWGALDVRVLYHKQLHEPPEKPVPGALSTAWEATLRSGLAADPRERPQSMPLMMRELASELPAIPPFVPSGADILRTVARKLIDDTAPDDETVRNQSNRVVATWWPRRETGSSDDLPPLNVVTSMLVVPAAKPLATTMRERPEAMQQPLMHVVPKPNQPVAEANALQPASVGKTPAMQASDVPHLSWSASGHATPTTMGLSTGVVTPRAPEANRRRWLVAGMIVTIAAIAVFALVSTSRDIAPMATRPTTGEPPRIPSAPPTNAPPMSTRAVQPEASQPVASHAVDAGVLVDDATPPPISAAAPPMPTRPVPTRPSVLSPVVPKPRSSTRPKQPLPPSSNNDDTFDPNGAIGR